jgi:hypothetical protein
MPVEQSDVVTALVGAAGGTAGFGLAFVADSGLTSPV